MCRNPGLGHSSAPVRLWVLASSDAARVTVPTQLATLGTMPGSLSGRGARAQGKPPDAPACYCACSAAAAPGQQCLLLDGAGQNRGAARCEVRQVGNGRAPLKTVLSFTRWITVTEAPHTSAVARILNLHADAIGVVEVQLFRVATLRNLGVQIQRLELRQRRSASKRSMERQKWSMRGRPRSPAG